MEKDPWSEGGQNEFHWGIGFNYGRWLTIFETRNLNLCLQCKFVHGKDRVLQFWWRLLNRPSSWNTLHYNFVWKVDRKTKRNMCHSSWHYLFNWFGWWFKRMGRRIVWTSSFSPWAWSHWSERLGKPRRFWIPSSLVWGQIITLESSFIFHDRFLTNTSERCTKITQITVHLML